MSLRRALFGLAAMIPAAFNTAPAAAARMLNLPVCDGSGVTRMVQVPVGGTPLRPRQGDAGCCVKGCHSPSSRKRGSGCHFDPSQ
jgi:hypothetical protein